jgi:hypothetical protein
MKHPSPPNVAKLPKSVLFTCICAALLLAGCVVTSVFPWYTDKDVVYDAAVVGTWLGADANAKTNEFWKIEKQGEQAYKLTIVDSDDKRSEFDAHLFKLDNRRYLDFLPRDREGGGIPPHYLMRVDSVSPTLDLVLLDYGWLEKLVTSDPNAIRHTIVPKPMGESGNGDLVLTANTPELQAFLRKHAANTNAFAEPTRMNLR